MIDKGFSEFNNEAIFSIQSKRVEAKNGNMEKAKKLDGMCQKQFQSKKNKGKGRCLNIQEDKGPKNKKKAQNKEKTNNKKSS